MFDTKWYSIISETQFAVHQTVLGVSALARSVHPDQLLNATDANTLRHTLHNGLFAYTTGIERLAKLTLSAVSYRTDGQFPKVKKFGHKISELLRLIENVDVSQYTHKNMSMQFAKEGIPLLTDSEFVSLLDDYAQGSGRYEFLDSLSNPGREPDLYERWKVLSKMVTPTESVTSMCGLPRQIQDSLYSGSRLLGEYTEVQSFDWLIEPYIDNFLNDNLYDSSAEIALRYYELVRWVAAHLSAVSAQIFYHDPRSGDSPTFPYLPEAIDRYILLERDLFFQTHVLKLNDIQATLEVIDDVMRTSEAQ